MAGASISGLSSGLDTATIVSQFMKLEALPQTRLKTRLTDEQNTLKLLQELNTKMSALKTQAADLAKSDGFTAVTAKSSNDKVTVTSSGTGTAVAGSVDFTVVQTAQSHRLTFNQTALSTDQVSTPNSTVKLTVGGVDKEVQTGDGSLKDLVKGINAAGAGVNASVITLDDGTQRLSVTAAKSGQAGAFTLTNNDGSDLLGGATVRAGQDAKIQAGVDTLSSATNTFDKVLAGASFTISEAAVGQSVTVSASPDTAAARGKFEALVKSANDLLTRIDDLTKYDAGAKKSGALAGESTVRSLRSQILQTVYPPDGSSLAGVGVQTDRYGKLVFDGAAFDKAMAADPAKVSSALVSGFAGRIEEMAARVTHRVSGTLTTRIEGESQGIRRLEKDISVWDERLAARKETLTRQFTALETALSRMQSQGNWLAGQISKMQ